MTRALNAVLNILGLNNTKIKPKTEFALESPVVPTPTKRSSTRKNNKKRKRKTYMARKKRRGYA